MLQTVINKDTLCIYRNRIATLCKKRKFFILVANYLHLITKSYIFYFTLFNFFLATGVVYFSPWCFQSPMEQLELLETGSAMTVQSYMAYIKDLTGLLANPGLHPSVKPDVATLAQVLEHFKKQHIESPLNKFIIRR